MAKKKAKKPRLFIKSPKLRFAVGGLSLLVFLASIFGYWHVVAARYSASQPVTSPVLTQESTPKTAEKPKEAPKTAAPQPTAQKKVAAPPTKKIPAVTTAKPTPVVKPAPTSKVTGLTPATPSSDTSPGTGGSQTNPPTTTAYYSTNWGGYIAANGTFTEVSGSWTVPAVSGNGHTTSADGSWIGIGGVTSGDLIQVGTGNFVAGNGTVTRFAFYELLPAAAQIINTLPINQGDFMSASVSELSAGQWRISLTNNTTSQSFTTTVDYASSRSTAEWVQEDPSYSRGNLIPYDYFGTVTFTNSRAVKNGTSVNLLSSNATPVTTVTNQGIVVASPSAIFGGGTSFSVTRQ